jgi:uncharacterized protein (TIGR00162 family)
MIETEIISKSKPKLKDPVCIVGLPGIGNIGRIAVGYAITQLKAKKFADLYSPYFYPFVMIHNDQVHILRDEFFFYKGKKRDIIFLIGDSQTYDPKGHYEITGKILDFLDSLGCKEIITVGGFSTGKVSKKPKVYGVVTDKKRTKELSKYGIIFEAGSKIGTIVGAAGLLSGFAEVRGIKGTVLLGETVGFPIITDPTAAEAVLLVLEKMLGIDIDLAKLEEKVKAMQEFIKKLEQIQTQAAEQLTKTKPGKEELKYIG